LAAIIRYDDRGILRALNRVFRYNVPPGAFAVDHYTNPITRTQAVGGFEPSGKTDLLHPHPLKILSSLPD
jgi:hypothetical protein